MVLGHGLLCYGGGDGFWVMGLVCYGGGAMVGHGGNGRSWWVFFMVFFFSFPVVVVLVDFFLEVACDCDGGCYGWWCWCILMGFMVGC